MTTGTSDIIKLVPTLSPEERFKMVMTDCLRQMDGEPSVFSETELKALIFFDSKAKWIEYVRPVIIFKLANAYWPNEIEIRRLRVELVWFIIVQKLEQICDDADDGIAAKDRLGQFDTLKKYIAAYNETLPRLMAYRDAIPELEAATYGVPFFSEGQKTTIAKIFTGIESSMALYNEMVTEFAKRKDARKLLRPFTEDLQSFLLRNEAPDPKAVTELVEAIKRYAESELSSRN
jgi:hypothetical protein